MKKLFLSLMCLLTVLIFNANSCQAEKVLIYQEHKNGKYTGVDCYAYTESIKKDYFVVRKDGQRYRSKKRACVSIKTDQIVSATGENKYASTWYYFYKNVNGKWFNVHSSNSEAYWLDVSLGFSVDDGTYVEKILDVVKNNFDCDSLPNTEANANGGFGL